MLENKPDKHSCMTFCEYILVLFWHYFKCYVMQTVQRFYLKVQL